MKLYVNKNLIFDGTLDKGGGEAPADQSFPVGEKQEQDESRERALGAPLGESREVRKMAGTDEELPPPAGAVVDVKLPSQGTLLVGKMNPPDGAKDSLSKLDEGGSCSGAPASTGGAPGAPPLCPPVECPPLDPELSLAQQLENLMSRKVSEPPAKTPSWLQPSATGKGGKQAGRKSKPLWLSPEKPLDWEGGLGSDTTTNPVGEAPREAKVGEKGSRREPGRPNSWNVLNGERAQKVTPRVCDDFDIFNQPACREHPASGRRGPRKDSLVSSHRDSPPTGRGKFEKPSDPGAVVPECAPLIGTIPFGSANLCFIWKLGGVGGSSQPIATNSWSWGHGGGSDEPHGQDILHLTFLNLSLPPSYFPFAHFSHHVTFPL